MKSLPILCLLALGSGSAEASPDIWNVPDGPAPAVYAALYVQLPPTTTPHSRVPLEIRSASQQAVELSAEDLIVYGPEQLNDPSSLEAGSPEELVLRFISALEAPKGYDDYFRGVRLAPPLPLSQMSLGDVMQWQVAAGARRNGYKPKSVAVGSYQVITSTLSGVARALELDPAIPFDAATQDRIGLHLLYTRGFGDFLEGRLSLEDMGNSLAREWAGLPILSGPDAGKSAYWRDGVNRALVSPSVFRAVLAEAKALADLPDGLGSPPLIILSEESR